MQRRNFIQSIAGAAVAAAVPLQKSASDAPSRKSSAHPTNLEELNAALADRTVRVVKVVVVLRDGEPHDAVTAGALPTGTSLNSSSGVISGTPSASGIFTFTVTVTDSHGNTGSQNFSITIAAPASSGGGAYTFIS